MKYDVTVDLFYEVDDIQHLIIEADSEDEAMAKADAYMEKREDKHRPFHGYQAFFEVYEGADITITSFEVVEAREADDDEEPVDLDEEVADLDDED